MPEPFKNLIRPETLRPLALALAQSGNFDAEGFLVEVAPGLEPLELKDRVRHVARALARYLDPEFPAAAAHILASLPPPTATEGTTATFAVWPLCQFVEDNGLDHPEVALGALYELTRRFSAEFAIRPFLLRDPEGVLALLHRWAEDPDPHVRRLVSEGTRPRLPWGLRLSPFLVDPAPLLPLLERLRDDPEEYVRRSVANNLNDIAKDHPEVVVETCRRWLQDAPEPRRRLVGQALRTLVKQGHTGALALLGVGPAAVEVLTFTGPQRARTGEAPRLRLALQSTAEDEQKLVIDYVLEMPGAGGRTNRKVFKWTTRDLAPGAVLSLEKGHSFAPVTTRRTRPGPHRFVLQVNGQSMAEHWLDLDG